MRLLFTCIGGVGLGGGRREIEFEKLKKLICIANDRYLKMHLPRATGGLKGSPPARGGGGSEMSTIDAEISHTIHLPAIGASIVMMMMGSWRVT
jgi:hypothetical protein